MVSKAGHVTHRLISWTNSPTDTVGPLRSYTVAFRTTWTNEQRSDLSWRLRLGLYYGAIDPKNGNGYFQFWGSWEWAKERLGCVSRYGTPKCSSYFFGTFDAFLVWMEMSLHIGAVLSPTRLSSNRCVASCNAPSSRCPAQAGNAFAVHRRTGISDGNLWLNGTIQ